MTPSRITPKLREEIEAVTPTFNERAPQYMASVVRADQFEEQALAKREAQERIEAGVRLLFDQPRTWTTAQIAEALGVLPFEVNGVCLSLWRTGKVDRIDRATYRRRKT